MHEDICFADATELARRIRDRELSPVEVMQAHLERIDAINPKLNAIVTLAEDALDQARAAEQALMKGTPIGPLHGVPFTCKDSFDVAGVRTTHGSKLFEHHVAERDAVAVARLKQAGAILLGKTNTPEFTLWWETDNRVFGRTNNPWNPERIAGGSSGGEAAALVTGLTALGVGSDVGGSLRMPAHYCGVVGFKPTHGRVPLTGLFPEVLLRMMHVGPLARTVRDAALALRLMCGPDGTDPWCVPVAPPELPEAMEQPLRLRVGWLADGAFAPVSEAVQEVVAQAARALGDAGCDVEHVPLSVVREAEADAIPGIVGTPETAYYFERFIRGWEFELSPLMGRRLAGPWPTLREYTRRMADWESLRNGMMQYFQSYDLLLCPTLPTPAYPHGQREITVDGVSIKARHKLKTVVPWNLTGSPALSLPFGLSADGLPIGVQLVGRHFDEVTVLRAALALESVSAVRGIRPPVA